MRFITFGSPGKPCLVKYFKWLLKVIKGQRAGKGQGLAKGKGWQRARAGKGAHIACFT